VVFQVNGQRLDVVLRALDVAAGFRVAVFGQRGQLSIITAW